MRLRRRVFAAQGLGGWASGLTIAGALIGALWAWLHRRSTAASR